MRLPKQFKKRFDAVRHLKLKGWTMTYYHQSGSVTLSNPNKDGGYDVWKEAKGVWRITPCSEGF